MLMACAGYETLRDISVIEKNGRSGGIRTPDPQAPSLIRYQTALRSDMLLYSGHSFAGASTRQKKGCQ